MGSIPLTPPLSPAGRGSRPSSRPSIYSDRTDGRTNFSLRQLEIADTVVRGRAKPHAAFIVEEEVAHGVLGARQRIFGHLACVRIEPPDDVHVFGRVPDLLVGIDAERIGRGLRP